LKIDGAVALSFAAVAAGQNGRPLDPEELRNFKPIEVDTEFDARSPFTDAFRNWR
jgi:hypothetical protein